MSVYQLGQQLYFVPTASRKFSPAIPLQTTDSRPNTGMLAEAKHSCSTTCAPNFIFTFTVEKFMCYYHNKVSRFREQVDTVCCYLSGWHFTGSQGSPRASWVGDYRKSIVDAVAAVAWWTVYSKVGVWVPARTCAMGDGGCQVESVKLLGKEKERRRLCIHVAWEK